MANWSAVVLIGLLGCKTGEVRPPPPTPGLARVPKVSVASVVVANPPEPPPVVLVLDANSNLHAARVATWNQLATKDPVVGSRSTTPYGAELRLREGEGKKPYQVYSSFVRSDASIERGIAKRLEEQERAATSSDDSAPSEDEDGSTAPRYKSWSPPKNRDEVLALLLEGAQRRARRELTEIAGARTIEPDESLGLGGGPVDPLATAVTEWMDERALQKSSAVLLAAPSAPATELIALIARLHPRIAVAEGNRVRPLRLETSDENDWDRASHWIELRLGVSDLTLEAVPDAPLPVSGPLDLTTLAAALDEARSRRDLDPLSRVDVLVDPSVDVQRLIDVLVALEQVGVKMVGLGEVPPPDSLPAQHRGHRSPDLSMGQPNSQGDLDKSIIRAFIKRRRPEILACYARSSAYFLGAKGTVQTQFFITPNGNVATSSGSGLDPDVANCVADVIKTIEFPKPKGGGGVQVNYPFTFRR
jgi:hypothetical protein